MPSSALLSSSRQTSVDPILADIKQADSNNFKQIPNLPSGGANRIGWARRIVHRCDVETVLYMIEPWERLLVQAVCVLFVASALHFAFGNSINWLSFFE